MRVPCRAVHGRPAGLTPRGLSSLGLILATASALGAPVTHRRSHLVALRQRKISASDPPSTWWPGER